ncbi:MAG: hypothetical protein AAGA55_00715 [Planctomycetota bacterium]
MIPRTRTTDGLGSAGTLAVLAIVLQLWVAGATSARAHASDRTGPSIVHTLREVHEHSAPPMPQASDDPVRVASEPTRGGGAPNQPHAVTRSGVWMTAVPPPAAAS